jgi:ElaB/YqjD/DUF883 family membrane-anchored ribosome-binding protein
MGTLSKDNGVGGMGNRIEETANALGDRISSTISGAGERVARAASGASDRVSSAASSAKDRGGALIDSLGTMMKQHPFATIAIGLGVGFVVAKLMARR